MLSQKKVNHLLIRLLIAVVAAHFAVVHSAQETWLELFTKPYYYLSLLYSTIIAFLLIEYVYFSTKKIQNTFKETCLSLKHLCVQFLVGFVSTTVLAAIMATVLFWLNNENILKSGYFNHLFIFIAVFILAVNLAYVLYFNQIALMNYHWGDQPELTPAQKTWEAVLKDKNLKLTSPALIFHDEKSSFSIDFNGLKSSWPKTLKETMKILDLHYHYRISRKCIIHRAAIVAVKPHGNKLLKVELFFETPMELVLSRRKVVNFKEWLKPL